MKTLPALMREREEFAARLAGLREQALEEAKILVELFDFDPVELGIVKTQYIARGRDGASTFPAKHVRRAPEPKYQDPETGQTWSGRGHEPRWMQGHRDEYLIRHD